MRSLSRALFAVLLIVSPLALGSNRAAFWAVNATAVSICLILLLLKPRRSWPDQTFDSLTWLIIALVVLPMLWMATQLVPNMPSFLAHPTWRNVPDGMATITLDPLATSRAMAWWWAMPVVFVAFSLARKSASRRNLMWLIVWIGLGEATFGLANLYFGWNTVGLLEKTAYLDYLTGTFVNRNSSASFLSITLAVLSSLTIDQLQEERRKSRASNPVERVFLILTSHIFYLYVATLILLLALLLTGSRAGVICGILGQVIVYVFALPRLSLRGTTFGIATLLFAFVLAVSVFALLDRASEGASSAQERILMAQDALEVIAKRPLVGHGAGAYESAEPLSHIGSLSEALIYNHAHNTYLEAAANLGVPFVVTWLLGFWLLIYVLWRRAVEATTRGRYLPACTAFLAVFVAESLHAIVDFSMQVQANAIFASSLLGFAWAELERYRVTATGSLPNRSNEESQA